MSKAFTKEESGPPEVVRRAPGPALAPGEPNYVTPRGARMLAEKRATLEASLRDLPRTGEANDAYPRAEVEAALAAVVASQERAVVVEPRPVDAHEGRVSFGAEVEIELESGERRVLRIVGVDEADPREGRISWCAPLAKALLGGKAGDAVTWRAPRGDEELEIVSVAFPAD